LAFSLIEVLGAVTVGATLATISYVSVKDGLQAGQRSAVQRELQALNNAWNNFKAADALRALRSGQDLSGANFAQLTEDPPMTMEIGGETYSLAFDAESGFSYVPDNGGAALTGGGGEQTPQNSSEGFPFDITDPDAVARALAELEQMSPEDPRYWDYINGLKAAQDAGVLPEDTEGRINTVLDGAGLIKVGNQWHYPDDLLFEVSNLPKSDPALVFYLDSLNQAWSDGKLSPDNIAALNPVLANQGAVPVRNQWLLSRAPTEAQYLAWLEPNIGQFLSAWGQTGYGNSFDELKRAIDDWSHYPGERTYEEYVAMYDGNTTKMYLDFFGYPNTGIFAINEPTTPTEWDQLTADLAGSELGTTPLWGQLRQSTWAVDAPKGLDWAAISATGLNLTNMNFVGSNVSAETLAATNFTGSDVSGINLAGSNLSGKNLFGTNLTGTNLTTQELMQAYDFRNADLANLDLTGFDFSKSGLVSAYLSGGMSLSGANLVGTNLKGSDLYRNYDPATDISRPRGIFNFRGANLSGLDLTGYWNHEPYTAGTNLENAYLVGATNVTGLIRTSTNLRGANLTGLDLNGAFAGSALVNPPGSWYNPSSLAKDLTGANLSNARNVDPSELLRKSLNRINGVDLRGATTPTGAPITKSMLQQLAPSANIDWGSVLTDN
jgi:uncharacterized protein YjbI with pentapeptide repeats